MIITRTSGCDYLVELNHLDRENVARVAIKWRLDEDVVIHVMLKHGLIHALDEITTECATLSGGDHEH